MDVLNKYGYTPEQLSSLDFRDWKGIADAIFSKPPQTPAIAPEGEPKQRQAASTMSGRKPASSSVQEEDEIPF